MYGKIYEQTFTGSMYGSGSCIFALWSYVIAHTKPDAMVELNPVALASTLGEEVAKIREAIEVLKSPDTMSRSKEFEGRRLLQKGEFIYFVPQYHKYHGFANDKERREYFAQKKREQRQRDREGQTVKSKLSKNVKQSDAYTDTKSDSEEHPLTPSKEGGASKARPSSCEEVVDFCLSISLPKSDGIAMWEKWQARGWGKMKDWRATIRQWKAFSYLPSQKQASGRPKPPDPREQKNEREAGEAKERLREFYAKKGIQL